MPVLLNEAGKEIDSSEYEAYGVSMVVDAGNRLCKLYKRKGADFEDCTNLSVPLFRYRRHAWANLADLASRLEQLRKHPDFCIIRGKFIGHDSQCARRGLESWEDVATHWLILDVDGLDVRALGFDYSSVDMANDQLAIELVVSEFLDIWTDGLFKGASFVAMPSGSIVCKGGDHDLRCRVFMQLAAPATLKQQHQLLLRLNKHVSSIYKNAGFEPGPSGLIDTGIAARNTLILTAQGYLLREDGESAPMPFGFPVVYLDRDKSQAEVPEEWYGVDRALNASDRPGLAPAFDVAEGIAGDLELVGQIEPGRGKNFIEQQLLFRIAFRHWQDEAGGKAALEAVWDELQAAVSKLQSDDYKADREQLKQFDYCVGVMRRIWERREAPQDLATASGRQLQALGLKQEQLEGVLANKYQHATPIEHDEIPALSLAQGRNALAWAADGYLKCSLQHNPVANFPDFLGEGPVSIAMPATHLHASVTVGVGKSYVATKLVTAFQERLINELALWAVPDHKLAEQAVADLRAELRSRSTQQGWGLDVEQVVRHHKGRKQGDMCPDRVGVGTFDKLAADYEDLGLSPLPACQHCPHFKTCPWIAQREDRAPGIIVMTHPALYAFEVKTDVLVGETLGAMKRNSRLPDQVVVDENILNTALGEPMEWKVDNLMPIQGVPILAVHIGSSFQPALEADELEFKKWRSKLVSILRPTDGSDDLSEGLLLDKTVQASGIAKDNIDRVLDLEHDHRAVLMAAITAEIERAAVAGVLSDDAASTSHLGALKGSYQASQIVTRIWHLLRLHFDILGREHVWALRVIGSDVSAWSVRRLPEWMAFVPTIWLDGTADPRIVRRLIECAGVLQPNLEFCDIHVEPSNSSLTVIADNAYSTSRLLDDRPRHKDDVRDSQRKAAGTEKQTRTKRRSDSRFGNIERFIQYLAKLHTRDKVLVIASKKLRDDLEPNAPDVRFLHYGLLRGQNVGQDVRAAIIIGRDTPQTDRLEFMAEAVFSNDQDAIDIGHEKDGWPSNSVEVPMSGGYGCEITGERHGDPLVAAVQRQIVDAEVAQAVGRVRAVQRGESGRPVDIFQFGRIAPGMPVTRICNLEDVLPKVDDMMLESGLAPLNGATAKQLWPAFLPSSAKERNAANKQAISHFKAGRIMGFAPKYIYKGANPTFNIAGIMQNWRLGEFRLNMQRTGSKRKHNKQKIYINVDMHADPKSALENALGEEIEWMGWVEDRPRQIEVEQLQPEYAGIVSPSALPQIANDVVGRPQQVPEQ